MRSTIPASLSPLLSAAHNNADHRSKRQPGNPVARRFNQLFDCLQLLRVLSRFGLS